MAQEKATVDQLTFLETVHESLVSEQTMNLIEETLRTNQRIRETLESGQPDDQEFDLMDEREGLIKRIQQVCGEDISPLMNLSYNALSEKELELLLNNAHLLELRLQSNSKQGLKKAQSEIKTLLKEGRAREFSDKLQKEELLREQLRFVRRRVNEQLSLMKNIQEGNDNLRKSSLAYTLLPKVLKLVEGAIPAAAKEVGMDSYTYEGERTYYKAMLTKTIRKHIEDGRFEEALMLLQGFYKKLSQGLQKGVKQGKSGIQDQAKEFLTASRKAFPTDLLAEMQHIYGQEDAPRHDEVLELIRHGSDDRGSQIYGYSAASSLLKLEQYRLNEVYDELFHPEAKLNTSYVSLMAEEYKFPPTTSLKTLMRYSPMTLRRSCCSISMPIPGLLGLLRNLHNNFSSFSTLLNLKSL